MNFLTLINNFWHIVFIYWYERNVQNYFIILLWWILAIFFSYKFLFIKNYFFFLYYLFFYVYLIFFHYIYIHTYIHTLYKYIYVFIFFSGKFFNSTMCSRNYHNNIITSITPRATKYFTVFIFFRCKQQIVMECNNEQIWRWYEKYIL